LAAAWQNGVRYFDTAPWYGNTLAEQRLGHFLRQQQRAEFAISTKVGRVYRRPKDLGAFDPSFWAGGLQFQLRFDYGYDGVVRSFEDSLHRLGLPRVDLPVRHRDVRALHGVPVRRLHHGAVAPDRGDRLDPEGMGLAVSGEQAAIDPGQQAELGQLLRQPLPLLPGLIPQAGGAGRDLGCGSRLGIVQAALAGVAAQPDHVARQRFSASHRVLTFSHRPDDRKIARQP
jgi:hypothetical protein